MQQLVDINVRVFGLDATLSVQPENRESVLRQWEWCLPDAPAQRTIDRIAAPAVFLGTASTTHDASQPVKATRQATDDDANPDAADYALTTQLTTAAISARRGEYVMLHAGGIANADGRVAALIAASGTGKTTATRHFCTSHEYGYVTDETLIFNEHCEVLPYPKPLSVIPPDGISSEKRQYSPTDLGFAPPAPGPLHVGPFILLNRLRTDEPDDRPAPVLEQVDLLDALATLLPQSSSLPSIPDCLNLLATVATERGGFWELRYREIDGTLSLIQQAFDAPASQQEWRHIAGNWADKAADISPYRVQGLYDASELELTEATVLERGAFVDALSVDNDERVLLLNGNTPTTLGGIGAAIWITVGDAQLTLAQAVRHCVEHFGDHPEATGVVTACVRELVSFGVLTVV